jgi:hypothetical protein
LRCEKAVSVEHISKYTIFVKVSTGFGRCGLPDQASLQRKNLRQSRYCSAWLMLKSADFRKLAGLLTMDNVGEYMRIQAALKN